VTLFVNGEVRKAAEGLTLQQLLDTVVPDGSRVAVVVNDTVVPLAERAGFALKEADRVELLTFAGGG